MASFSSFSCMSSQIAVKKASAAATPPTDSMLLHLKFDSGDFVGSTLANWATGAAVYDVQLSGNTLPQLKTSGQKVGTGCCNIASNTTLSMIMLPFSFNTYQTPLKQAISVALWFQVTNNGQSYQHIMCLGSTTTYIRFINGTLAIGGSSGEYNTGNTSLYSDRLWHHVVLMMNAAGQITVYIDGVNKVINQQSAYFSLTDTNIWLGQFTNSPSAGTNAFAFTGNLDDVRIYSRMLTAAEVALIYANTI